jgi:nicotinate phosphoribosyltransferase
MLQAYAERGMRGTAVFELFVRALPPSRAFLLAAGLEPLLDWIEGLRFGEDELDWVRDCGLFRPDFAQWLAGLRFEGDIDAMPEGTVFFANEPLLRVTAPLPQAQLVESRLVNLIHYQTLVASKAARCVLAAGGRRLIDFGLRRAHGAEAGLAAARASWIAGFDGTATALAAPALGLPVFGTMAHSFVQAHADEAEAFRHFAEVFPANAVLLIDTYDTEAAARKVVALAPALARRGIGIRGVRLDSGDLETLSRSVRALLDAGGLREAIVFASGNLDEHRVRDLVRAGAPIDAYGIGTALTTSSDAPNLDMVYKLQEYDGRATRKRSAGKATWPGRKQVFRWLDGAGRLERDEIALESESRDGRPLLEPVMRGGRRLRPAPSLESLKAFTHAQLQQLPEPLRALPAAAAYPVSVSDAIRTLAARIDRSAAVEPWASGRPAA